MDVEGLCWIDRPGAGDSTADVFGADPSGHKVRQEQLKLGGTVPMDSQGLFDKVRDVVTTTLFTIKETDISLSSLVVFIFAMWARRRRQRRKAANRCVDCGYDLTGNVSGRCPECGQVIP